MRLLDYLLTLLEFFTSGMNTFKLAIHGGAGTILRKAMNPEREKTYREGLQAALEKGYEVLANHGSSMDAVVAAVVALENNTLFNAGKGSVFTHEGKHEMDAAVMDGQGLKAGAVAGIMHIKNPVKLAQTVMNKTDHVFLWGEGAETVARKNNLEFEEASYFFDSLRHEQWLEAKSSNKVMMDHRDDLKEKKFGTVGAVALDSFGNLSAATSTGGMTNKQYNRIGDTPVIGSGTYANNKTCAISCTGHGEYFLRAVVAYDVSCLMEYKGLSLAEACNLVVHDKLVKIGGEGGLIAIDQKGNVELIFNSEGMYRGTIDSKKDLYIGIYK
jgi:beta-aspartyl-peptidase (threonine type)